MGILPKSRQPRVLVIDDSNEIAEFVRLTLEDSGIEVIETYDGTSGFQLFRTESGTIDLILLDIAMSDINGLNVLADIRTISCSVPVILMSGYIQSISEALSLGANDVLGKPFSMSELEAKAKRWLKNGKSGKIALTTDTKLHTVYQ